ncbi:MAG: LacI family DNA-binding transcriptional regulator [Roseibium album]|uniref:LacI family DNA-binding transcriptional regulator n=1 Tax=Roseibium album TaxID=311410 RepID=UPI0018C9BD48|nr:LacI family DNA-binding transcriptional regulator [Roseibium album]MBG6153975.1 DNA-binding LacI/PurR family transcriptional regulator [Labrenzia sp. EL_162]MBG6164708.1 DNA-binding LacI/PurR family transcriptional regulator [Labrenzia sp. EL_195]MBG6193896.1 DNA-binding LacI/PurR family transcriptional regulator [Labrenzia sp. EL_159]MBG6207149.1 DNA-binding LacI/PurR family transcriptional regulator [Labrenzia sp. EL_126]
MRAEKVTSVDVAMRAGVSQSAVSRVFTPGASVSPKMAEKVLKAAQELGYRPNVLARSLITGRSRIIGLVVAYLENQFYPDALERLSTALQAHGYHILVFMVSNDDAGVDRVMGELLDYQVDGIITASVGMSNALAARCAAAGVPVVLFNRGQDDHRLNQVTSNNLEGGRKIAEFLAAGGHRRIAHIAGWSGSSTGRDREAGFRAGLEAAGVGLAACVDGMYNRETAAAAAREIFAGDDRPDAVFVGNDHMAFAVMDVLRFELNLDIPGDVSVVGYDDVPLASWPAYNLTTLRQPSNRMVEATVSTLLGWIEEGSSDVQKIQIDGPLMVRGSARIPEGWLDERL